MKTFFWAPLDDYFAAVQTFRGNGKAPAIFIILLGFCISWWIYVPAHELLHAAGCIMGGGQVMRLDIKPLYGAGLLSTIFPFVHPGSEYAGRLSGFVTNDSDLTYLLTVFMPYLLTILIGVPLLRSIPRSRKNVPKRSAMFGLSLPVAYAPFISVTGDYYEAGSIIVSRAVSLFSASGRSMQWRSDDIFRLLGSLDSGISDYAGIFCSLATGIVLVFATYRIGHFWAGIVLKR